MSIADKTGQNASVTEVWRALDLFTNRESLIGLFIAYLNEDPPQEKILFFYGEAGNGKSLLLRYLREHFCKRFTRENWEWLKCEFSDHALIEHVKQAEENLLSVPYAALDFGLRTTSEDRPQEAFYGLLMLRRQLAAANIQFPLFDFACVWYLHKTKQLSADRLKNLFPADEMDFLGEIADAASGTSVGAIAKTVINIFGKYIRGDFTVWLKKRGLDEARVAEIQQMDAETDLIERLPDFFAADLNSAMTQANAPERIVLFFDTHESFWGYQRQMPQASYFRQDEWLRRLLIALNFEKGIVSIVAGREAHRWNLANRSNIPKQFIDTHLVGHLSPDDAENFLLRAGIDNADLQQSLIKYTEVGPDEIHPLFLGLSADIVLAATRRGENLSADDFRTQPLIELKEMELIDRLLSYVDMDTRNAVIAMAAARAFDKSIYAALGREANFNTTDAAFGTLRSFSFVWPSERRGEGWYRIHDLLRRLFSEYHKDRIEKAHVVLEKHYRELIIEGDELALSEAIYHANQLDAERGVIEWRDSFRSALQISRHRDCRFLLDVRREMTIPGNFLLGQISYLEGDFYSSLSFYSEAGQEYSESIDAYNRALLLSPDDVKVHSNKGLVLQNRGDLEAMLTRHDDAMKSYGESIDSYNRALLLSPDDVKVHSNKGLVLQNRGDLEARLTRHDDAMKSYGESVVAFDRALSLGPDDVGVHSNKGNVLQSRGELEMTLTRHEDALKSYGESVAAFDKALLLDPDNVSAHNNKGNVLQRRGDLEVTLTRHEDAMKSYGESVAAYDRALLLAPDDVLVHNNKGSVQARRGELEAMLTRHEDALKSYGESVAAFDKALSLAPDDIAAHSNKGKVLQSRGELEARLTRHNDALKSYGESVAAFDKALSLAPDYVSAHNNKGNVLQSRGVLEAMLTRHEDALKTYGESVAAYDKALSLAPDEIAVHNNKGNVLQNRGELEMTLIRHEGALKSYEEAVAAYDRALSLAPDDVSAHNNKGNALRSRGDLEAMLTRLEDALKSYGESVAAYNKALSLDPDDVSAHNNKGNALQRLGELEVTLTRHEDAMKSYGESVAAYDKALSLDPDDVLVHKNKGNVLRNQGDLEAVLAQHEDALKSYGESVAAYDRALSLAPDYVNAHNNKGNVLQRRALLRFSIDQIVEAFEDLESCLNEYSDSLKLAPDDEYIKGREKAIIDFLTQLSEENSEDSAG